MSICSIPARSNLGFDILMNALGDGLRWLDIRRHIHVAQRARLFALYIISIDRTFQDRG